MAAPSAGLHHVTAICAGAQRNIAFYTGVLGLRLVKLSVSLDSPDMYHLVYGDGEARPGSLLTFFAMPRAGPAWPGCGAGSAVALAVPAAALEFWDKRLAQQGVAAAGPYERFGERYLACRDPDGLRLELVGDDAVAAAGTPWRNGPVPEWAAIRGLHGVTAIPREPAPAARFLTEALGYRRHATQTETQLTRLTADSSGGTLGPYIDLPAEPEARERRLGTGILHHIAFRARDEAHLDALRAVLETHGAAPGQPRERFYHWSVYGQAPGNLLYEIATDTPGLTRDESIAGLGSALRLRPPQQDPERAAAIRKALPVLRRPDTGEMVP